MELFPDFADLLEAFGRHGVRYLLVGGYAVAIHATPRYTKDLDLWLSDDDGNRARAAAALAEFGAPSSVIESLRGSSAADVVWFGTPPVRVDLLQRIEGLQFDAAWQQRATVNVAGLEVLVIGLAHLIEVKRSAGRPRDLADVEALLRAQGHADEG